MPHPERMEKSVSVKTTVSRVMALIAIGISMSLATGGAMAHADGGYVGKSYADASAEAAKKGTALIVATVAGDVLPMNECVVTAAHRAKYVRGDNFEHEQGFRVALNCYAKVASNGDPGASAASPEGKNAKRDLKSVKWVNTTDDGAKWCSENLPQCQRLCSRTGLCTDDTLSIAG